MMRGVLTLLVCRLVMGAVPGWTVAQTKLLASDGEANDNLAWSVAMSGNYVIVGAPEEDSLGSSAGSAYVYERGAGIWTEAAKLLASDGQAGDNFGLSVAISGNYAIIGAPYEESLGPVAGAAYVFERQAGVWAERAKLLASDGGTGEFFGTAVAVSDRFAIVSANYESSVGSGVGAGSAYVFERQTGFWTETAKLVASDGEAGHYFGFAVAMDRDYAIIGAPEESTLGAQSGSAYVFERQAGAWTETAKLIAGDGDVAENFGWSVALSGDYAIVGAPPYGSVLGTGSYVFARQAGVWTQTSKLQVNGGIDGYFGLAVATSGDHAIVSAPFDNNAVGSAYVFERQGDFWNETAKILADDGEDMDLFGTSMGMSGSYAIVAAYSEDALGIDAGAFYLFSSHACPVSESVNSTGMCAPCAIGNSTLGAPCSCDPGQYRNDTSCLDCPALRTSFLGADDVTDCVCDFSLYLNDTGSCAACPSNSVFSEINSTSVADCACDQGYYNDGTGCASCGPGFSLPFSPIGLHDVGACVCDKGYFNDGTGCVSCGDPGAIVEASMIGTTSGTECVCDRGYYADAAGCVACPAGSSHQLSPVGSTAAAECVPCPINMFAVRGTDCQPCPATARAAAGSGECIDLAGAQLALPAAIAVAAAFVLSLGLVAWYVRPAALAKLSDVKKQDAALAGPGSVVMLAQRDAVLLKKQASAVIPVDWPGPNHVRVVLLFSNGIRQRSVVRDIPRGSSLQQLRRHIVRARDEEDDAGSFTRMLHRISTPAYPLMVVHPTEVKLKTEPSWSRAKLAVAGADTLIIEVNDTAITYSPLFTALAAIYDWATDVLFALELLTLYQSSSTLLPGNVSDNTLLAPLIFAGVTIALSTLGGFVLSLYTMQRMLTRDTEFAKAARHHRFLLAAIALLSSMNLEAMALLTANLDWLGLSFPLSQQSRRLIGNVGWFTSAVEDVPQVVLQVWVVLILEQVTGTVSLTGTLQLLSLIGTATMILYVGGGRLWLRYQFRRAGKRKQAERQQPVVQA